MNVGGGGHGRNTAVPGSALGDMEHGLMKEKSRMQDNNPQIQ